MFEKRLGPGRVGNFGNAEIALAGEKKQSVSNKTQSLVEQAYGLIKERIIGLHFLPGQYLNEAAISAQLGLGRTPVHQALQRLHVEGLVEVLPRKGIVVLPDSVSEILKILESRITVEPELARKAGERVRQGELTEDNCRELQFFATATDPDLDPPDIASFTVYDRKFHREIGLLSGNQVMADFVQKLHERSTRFWYLNLWQTINIEDSNLQHAAIAEAIVKGDGEEAASAVFAHIEALRNRLSRLSELAPHRGLPSAQ